MPKKYKKFIIDTLYKQRFPRKEFVEELQVTVCPYCNRNFVNSTYKRTMCDLDHFYDKWRLILYLQYLFIIWCLFVHACNHAKASKQYRIHRIIRNLIQMIYYRLTFILVE